MKRLTRLVLLLSLMCFGHILYAIDTPTWELIPGESQIRFTGIQNNSPISGEFKKFSAEITGDFSQLDQSHVRIIIDTSSLSISFKDLEDVLKNADWFNVGFFPQAVFEAKQFKKIDQNTYVAQGTITIRDKSLPLAATFNVVEHTKEKARVKGTTNIKRTLFGVGTGEWGSTDEVKDEVKVDFTLTARKRS